MDPISDMLTRIRNAQQARISDIKLPHSKLKENIARILKTEGYIQDFGVEGEKIRKLNMKLKFTGKRGVIEGMKRVSSPGLRWYVGHEDIPRVRGGLGVAIMSTSHGVMTGRDARKKNIGGEVLCYVW